MKVPPPDREGDRGPGREGKPGVFKAVARPLRALRHAGMLEGEGNGLGEAAALGKEDQLRAQILLCLFRQRRLLRLVEALEGRDGDGDDRNRLAAEEALTRLQGRLQQAIGLLHRMEHDAERIRVEDEKIAVARRRYLMEAPDAEALSETAHTLEGLLGDPRPPREGML